MTHILGIFWIWSAVMFGSPTTLEQAVALTPHHAEAGLLYYFGFEYAPGRHLGSAVIVSGDDDWQAIYDSTWKRMDETLERWGEEVSLPLPYTLGCWESHDCPPIYVKRVGDDSFGTALHFFSHLLRKTWSQP